MQVEIKSDRMDHDGIWKTILERFFQSFMHFFFSEAYQAIDWDTPYEMLDKELLQIERDSDTKKRTADKLFKVYLKDGQVIFVIVHVEIQNTSDSEFEYRMFQYNYRAHDKYQVPVMSLAVLTDEGVNWRPSIYEQNTLGCNLKFEFPFVKLRDYQGQESELIENKNVMAKIVLAHLTALLARRDAKLGLREKVRLAKSFYKAGFEGKDIQLLYSFLDEEVALPRLLTVDIAMK